MFIAGRRDYQVLTGVQGTFNKACQFVEITNTGGTDATVYLNDFPQQGRPANGVVEKAILVKAGTTRQIPLMTYNFRASASVTVVGYMA